MEKKKNKRKEEEQKAKKTGHKDIMASENAELAEAKRANEKVRAQSRFVVSSLPVLRFRSTRMISCARLTVGIKIAAWPRQVQSLIFVAFIHLITGMSLKNGY